jgi:hypothetical protein
VRNSTRGGRVCRLLLAPAIATALSACVGTSTPVPSASSGATLGATSGASSSTISPTDSRSPDASPSESQAPDTSGGTSHGDIPDNAVFLTYHGSTPVFSIQYVEGWQVSRQPDGVVIRDKDSSETIAIVAPQTDVPGYVASTDLPSLQAQTGFNLMKQDTVKVGGSSYLHLAYHLPAPPDPVTGKRVPSTVDRYYVPGPNGLAIVSLSTPDGVDNVDAFRQMIQSFRWA